MNLNLKVLIAKAKLALPFIKQYAAFIFVVTFLSIYVYQVNHIGHLIQDEPTQAAVDDKLKPVSQLKIDEASIKSITELESQNVEVKALFEDARQNPFVDCPSPRHIDSNGNCVQ
jgi:hypothetical protein